MPIETVAVETSSALAERARERPHHRNARVVAGSALGGLESLADDACRGAVLHSPPGHGAEPPRVLRQLGRVLMGAGVALINLPNAASWNRLVTGRHWCGFRHPDHLNYVTPATLGLLASIFAMRSRPASTWWRRSSTGRRRVPSTNSCRLSGRTGPMRSSPPDFRQAMRPRLQNSAESITIGSLAAAFAHSCIVSKAQTASAYACSTSPRATP